MEVTLPLLERTLVSRRPALAEAAALAGATPASIVQVVLAESAVAVSTAGRGGAGDGGGDSTQPEGAPTDPVTAAMWAPAFRALAHQLQAIDSQTVAGRLDAISLGFSPSVMLAVRQLLAPTKLLAGRHPALARLYEAAPDVGLYLTRLLASDPLTGDVRPRMSNYSVVGPLGEDGQPSAEGTRFLDSLLSLDFVRADWLTSPGGLPAYLAARDSCPTPTVYIRADAYTCPLSVEELCGFIHSIVVGFGGASIIEDTAANGMTFLQWGARYREHLKLVLSLPGEDERRSFLDHCDVIFVASLRKLGERLRAAIHAPRPLDYDLEFGPIRMDEEPYTTLAAKEAVIAKVGDLRHEWAGFLPPSGGLAKNSHGQWPLRSTGCSHASRSDQRGTKVKGKGAHARGGALGEEPEAAEEPPTTRKRKAPEVDELAGADGAAPPDMSPGAQPKLALWLTKTELFVSGRVWNVTKLAAKFGVQVSAKCWAYLLNRRGPKNRAALCPKWGTTGHTSDSDAAHVLSTLDLQECLLDSALCRLPTDEEFAKAAKHAGAPASPRSARGGDGRGRGRERGRSSFRGRRGSPSRRAAKA